MTPRNSPHKSTPAGASSSKNVIWQGPDLACITVCKGDSVTDVVAAIAEEVCGILDTLDLTDLELKCLIDTCLACPEPDKTLKTALGLIINKVCLLEELINNSTSTVPVIPVFQVNLKCLAITDGSGNVLNDDTNDKIIQSIIDQVCTNTSDILLINNDITDLDNRVTVLEDAASHTTEPMIASTCVLSGLNTVPDTVEALESAFCQLSTILGSTGDMNKAIGQQCQNLAQTYVLNQNFTIAPKNLAQSMRNIWVTMCDIVTRVTAIEKTCCGATCDQVKLGFSIFFSELQTATIKFSNGSGTNIPTGVVDCGSVLIVSDESGNSVYIENLNIANNVEVPDIDLTGFTEGGLLTFTLDGKMCSDTLGTCEKVVVKTAIYKNACSTCEVTNTGDGDVILVYDSFGGQITSDVTVLDSPFTSSTTSSTSTTIIQS